MKKISEKSALSNFVKENNCFKIEKQNVVCILCSKSFVYVPREGIKTFKRHLTSQSHCINKEKYVGQLTLEETCSLLTKNETFDRRLIEAFTAANIPLYKLQTPVFKKFLEDTTGMNIHDESYYRKMIVPLYAEKQKEIFERLKNQDIFLLFDETTDANGRYILNILGGFCDKKIKSLPYLLRSVELARTNSDTVSQEIIKLMIDLNGGNLDFTKLRLIVSDAAPYAVKAVKILKELFPNLKHVTCIAHLLHNLCEKLRDISPLSNYISSELKRMLVKNKKNQCVFKESTGLKLPKFPVLTRWGTWLVFMDEIVNNYDLYKNFIRRMVNENSIYEPLLNSFSDHNFILELEEIRKSVFLVDSITQLERIDLSTTEQIDILKFVKNNLKNPELATKYTKMLEKNPDLSFFYSLHSIKCNENDKVFLFVPLTTVDVERSFSKMGVVLDDLRRSLTVSSQEALLSFYFNKNLR